MYKISFLDLSNVSVSKISTKNESTLKLYDVNYPDNRPLQIYLHGTVAEPPSNMAKEYGGQLVFKFRPQIEDINSFVSLEQILEKGKEAIRLNTVLAADEIFVKDFELRSVIDKTNYLRMKLKTDKNGEWRFYTDELLEKNLDAMKTQLARSTPLTLTLGVGFYFDTDKKKYGIYLDVQEMLFNPGQQPSPGDKAVQEFLESNAQTRKSMKGKKTVVKVAA